MCSAKHCEFEQYGNEARDVLIVELVRLATNIHRPIVDRHVVGTKDRQGKTEDAEHEGNDPHTGTLQADDGVDAVHRERAEYIAHLHAGGDQLACRGLQQFRVFVQRVNDFVGHTA